MNKRQKIFVTTITVIILITIIAGFILLPQNKPENSGKLNVVATFYPLAYFAQEIGGDKVSVTQLIPDNTEVHNWQPSPSDIIAVDDADVLLYNGASLDHWFEEDILPIIDATNKVVMETTQGVSLLEASEEEHEDGHEHEGLYDPHTWISAAVAKQQAQNVYLVLKQKDPSNTEYYTDRWLNLKTRFEELDNRYVTELANKTKNDIFVSHAAFGYLANSYSFEQHGVIGISADEQPSAAAYVNLVDLMVEYETYVVYVNPVYSDESAQTLKAELQRLTGENVQILTLYFMLGNMNGLDYFGQQEQNLQNLKIGLGVQ
jgi:zinc transport system substrate-binding protein